MSFHRTPFIVFFVVVASLKLLRRDNLSSPHTTTPFFYLCRSLSLSHSGNNLVWLRRVAESTSPLTPRCTLWCACRRERRDWKENARKSCILPFLTTREPPWEVVCTSPCHPMLIPPKELTTIRMLPLHPVLCTKIKMLKKIFFETFLRTSVEI